MWLVVKARTNNRKKKKIYSKEESGPEKGRL